MQQRPASVSVPTASALDEEIGGGADSQIRTEKRRGFGSFAGVFAGRTRGRAGDGKRRQAEGG
jgi:hypothetical protein